MAQGSGTESSSHGHTAALAQAWQPFNAVHQPSSPRRSAAAAATTSAMLPPAPRSPISRNGSSSAHNGIRHAPSASIASTSTAMSHSQLVYQPQPTRSGRLPVPPRQEEISAMLSMENYFEFPSESESDDEDFVPTVGPDNDETPLNEDEATPDAFNMSVSYTGPVTRSSPLRGSSSPQKGKKRAGAAAPAAVDTGYSSAAEMGPIDSNEWEWLMDQMKSIENGDFLPPLPPQLYPHQQQHQQQLDLGNASEADADAESGSSPNKDGDVNSPIEPSNLGGLHTSWPVPDAATTNAAREIFALPAQTQAQSQAGLSSASTRTAKTQIAQRLDPPADVEENEPAPQIVRKRGGNGRFTKASKKGKNKAVVHDVYVSGIRASKVAAAQAIREESVLSIADSGIPGNDTQEVDPYTTIVPKKRGRGKNVPLSPRAEAAQADLRRARHLEQCEDYRERKKMKAENFEKRCELLEEKNQTLEEENRLLRKQIEMLREERDRDRRALVQAGNGYKSRRGARAAPTGGSSATDDEDDDQDAEYNKENDRHRAGRTSAGKGLSMEDVGKFVTMFMGMQKAQQPVFPLPPLPQSMQPSLPYNTQPGYQNLQYPPDPSQDQAYAGNQQQALQQYVNQQMSQQQQQQPVDYGDHAAAQAMLGMFGQLQQQQQQQQK